MRCVLVTGSDVVTEVTFVHAIHTTLEKFFMAEPNFNIHYINFPNLDIKFRIFLDIDPSLTKLS